MGLFNRTILATTTSVLLFGNAAFAQGANSGAETPASPLGKFMVPALQKDMPLLRGQVSTFKNRSPILSGSVQQIPENTKIDLVIPDGININSEISQKGDEVVVRIAKDIRDGDRVVIPGGWYMRGLVSDVASQKRLGRDGYVEVQFDKLVSPDGDYEVDFDAKFSTKDKKLKAIAKVVATDTGYVAAGSAAGALLSIQLTGVPGVIASQGYSVVIGAGVGGTIGLIGALKRKGKIRSLYSGDVLTLVTEEPVSLPCFDQSQLPSAQPKEQLAGLDMKINDYHFGKVWWDDKNARILQVDVAVANNTNQTFHFFDVKVINDHDQLYDPMMGSTFQKIPPGKSGGGKIAFQVGSPKRKYFLVFLSRKTGKELSRVAIN